MQLEFKNLNLKELQKSAHSLMQTEIRPPSLILISGPMGAGKTELVRALLSAPKMALDASAITSPTFSLQNIYEDLDEQFIAHWDFYRIQSTSEIDSSGFWEQFERPNYYIFVEWPEKYQFNLAGLRCQIIKINIEFAEPGQELLRKIMVKVEDQR